MASIKIETGLKVYDIEDENGNVRGQISFNPSDMNFFERAEKIKEKINELMDEAKKIDEESEKDVIEKLSYVDLEIKNQINMLFDDDNASRVVFGNQNCLNTLDGISFVERFLIAFIPIIQKAFNDENKKSVERINKYTSQVSE